VLSTLCVYWTNSFALILTMVGISLVFLKTTKLWLWDLEHYSIFCNFQNHGKALTLEDFEVVEFWAKIYLTMNIWLWDLMYYSIFCNFQNQGKVLTLEGFEVVEFWAKIYLMAKLWLWVSKENFIKFVYFGW